MRRTFFCLCRQESVYQHALQARYGYGHKRLPSGISDVTTADRHIEIKRWCLYKQALGQLLAYDFYDKKPILEAHLFGIYPEHKKNVARRVFDRYNITVVDLEAPSEPPRGRP